MDTTITLRDGRDLAVSVSGPEDGVPLLFHHGTTGCRLQGRHNVADAAARGLRLVTYTRAGAQGSTRRPGRTVADVAPDMADLLDWLGADRCLVAGFSGGGPHALATAALLPDRVAAVISIAGARPNGPGFTDGMGADNVEEFALSEQGEAALRPFLEGHQEALRDADAAAIIADLASLLPEVDRAVLRSDAGPEVVANLVGGAQSVDGWLDDDLAFVAHWGFELGDVAVPAYVWQGTADLMVPPHHGEYLAAHVPGAVAHLEDGEGHLSLEIGAFGRMLDEAVRHL